MWIIASTFTPVGRAGLIHLKSGFQKMMKSCCIWQKFLTRGLLSMPRNAINRFGKQQPKPAKKFCFLRGANHTISTTGLPTGEFTGTLRLMHHLGMRDFSAEFRQMVFRHQLSSKNRPGCGPAGRPVPVFCKRRIQS
jgi:hypothetical protein